MPSHRDLRELTAYGLTGLGVGWLEPGATVSRGKVNPVALAQLQAREAASQLPATATPCPLCADDEPRMSRPVVVETPLITFIVAPNTAHLMEQHGYLPPRGFVAALLTLASPPAGPPHLESLELVRRRPSLYVGGTDAAGLENLVFEVISNAIDQYLAGYATRIEVSVSADMSVTIRDDGAGLPCGTVLGIPFPETLFTTLHDTATFDGHLPHVHARAGLHGVGLGVVSALASSLELKTHCRGRAYRVCFSRGEVATPVEDLGASRGRGTTIRFRPDPDVFSAPLDRRALLRRLRDFALLAPDLRLVWNRRALRSGGLASHVRSLTGDADSPTVSGSGEVHDIGVDFALGLSHGAAIESFVNFARTADGGSHVEGLRLGVTRAAPLPELGRFVNAHLRAVVHAQLLHPRFGGPTKEHLNHPQSTLAVAEVVEQALRAVPPWWDWLVEQREALDSGPKPEGAGRRRR